VQHQTADAIWHLDRPINVRFAAFCEPCRPFKDDNPYEIPATPSAAAWLAWVTHLHEKTWMGKWDLYRMTAYWFHNRGLQPGQHLG
jgi:hypothetical protein